MRFIGTWETVSFCFAGTANPVENVPPERFQNQGIKRKGKQGGVVLFYLPLEKPSLFSPTRPRPKARAQGNFRRLRMDSDPEGMRKNTSPAAPAGAFSGAFFRIFRCCTMILYWVSLLKTAIIETMTQRERSVFHANVLSQIEPLHARCRSRQYIGGEVAKYCQGNSERDVRFCLCFPDTYEIGMSHLGMKILYSLINSRENSGANGFLRRGRISRRLCGSIRFRCMRWRVWIRCGSSISWALPCNNELVCHQHFEHAGFGWDSALCQRPWRALALMVIAGGPCVCNPNRWRISLICSFSKRGEEVELELMGSNPAMKKSGATRQGLRSTDPGIYVPSLYKVSYHPDGTIDAVTPE